MESYRRPQDSAIADERQREYHEFWPNRAHSSPELHSAGLQGGVRWCVVSTHLVLELTKASDQKQEMENKESLRSQSSQLSLVRVRSSKTSIASTPTASQTFEMTGATQDSEDDREPETFRPRRTDTEMGGRSQSSRFSPVDTRGATMAAATTSQVLGTTVAAQDGEADGKLVVASLQQVDTEVGERSQASGLESGDSRRQPQRRPTFPQMAGDQPAQEDIANDLSEGR